MAKTTAPALATILALAITEAHAQAWPTRTIEMIVPFPAGGGVDVIARTTANAVATADSRGSTR